MIEQHFDIEVFGFGTSTKARFPVQGRTNYGPDLIKIAPKATGKALVFPVALKNAVLIFIKTDGPIELIAKSKDAERVIKMDSAFFWSPSLAAAGEAELTGLAVTNRSEKEVTLDVRVLFA